MMALVLHRMLFFFNDTATTEIYTLSLHDALPISGFEQFPVIEMGSNGRGQLDAEIPMTLPTTGTYHVNVYWSGHQIADVLTCADRKSTRLNSSHANISYAVFCLKKKKQYIDI